MKLYVIHKYVMARSAAEAIKLEGKHKVDDVYVDDDWKRANVGISKDIKGFK